MYVEREGQREGEKKTEKARAAKAREHPAAHIDRKDVKEAEAVVRAHSRCADIAGKPSNGPALPRAGP